MVKNNKTQENKACSNALKEQVNFMDKSSQ